MGSNRLVAVQYDKGVGFFVTTKVTYENKLSHFLDSNQFSKIKETSDAIDMKIEKDINKELLAMRKKDEISENFYIRMMSTEGQTARFSQLVKVHAKTSLRPVLSLLFSSYYNRKKILANFGTNSLEAGEILESNSLEPNERLLSLDMKSLYTNVPLNEAIDMALRKLYKQGESPSTARKP